jgi:hypothetical protein
VVCHPSLSSRTRRTSRCERYVATRR